MKHLFGRVYFKAPCFIGFKLYNRKLVIILNSLLLVIIIAMVVIGLK